MEKSIGQKSVAAGRWSLLTEVVAKIVTPVSNMILARILAPEAFGVIATVTMVFSFADLFTDAGFQRYLVQHEFRDEAEKYASTHVAFWTNIGFSCVLWGVIAAFRDPIAAFVGSPGLGAVIAVACMQLPLTSFSSIQTALFERDFDFRTLFMVRLVAISVPFAVTIPLALSGFGYWSLVWGNIAGQLFNAVLLTARSRWKPKFYYRIKILKEMFSFSVWTLVDYISIWFSIWVDVFIVGSVFAAYELGLYKTSLNMVNSLIAVVTLSVSPVLFSALSRFQDNESSFKSLFLKVQKSAAYILFPLGLGLFLYSDVATAVMLGSQWSQAGFIIGIWGLTSVFKTVLSDFNSECYRAKGMPKLSLKLQLIYLAFLIPSLLFSVRLGFETLVYVRAFIRFVLVVFSLIAMQRVLHIPAATTLRQTARPAALTGMLAAAVLVLRRISDAPAWSIVSIVLCLLIYLVLARLFAKKDFFYITGKLIKRRKFGNKSIGGTAGAPNE